jgi:hypothetical protein
MPTVIRNPIHVNEHPPVPIRKREFTQVVGLILGFFLVIVALCGIMMPSFLGLHLSTIHSCVLGLAGALAFWSGAQDNLRKSYLADLGLGIFFSINALAGFVLGKPGNPQVGYNEADRLLLKIMPGFEELGTNDHVLHSLLAVGFFVGALTYWSLHKSHMHRSERESI